MKTKSIIKTGFLILAVAGSSAGLFAADIFSNTITDTNPSASNPFTSGQLVDDDITASGIGRGTGINASTAIDRYSATSWNTVALDTTAFFTWTLTPKLASEIDFTSFVYTGQASGTGPTSFAFRSSVDGFTTDVGTPTASGTTIVLTDAAFQDITSAIEFRMYGWAASGGTGTFSINSFTFNGTAIPEPSAYSLIGGLLALGLVASRRVRERSRTALNEKSA